jgi:hypothetical protein
MFSTTPTANVADGVQGTPYTVQQIDDVTNNLPFSVAIDVNTNNAAGETLQLFEVIVNGVVVYNFVGPAPIGGIANNGNGFGDWSLGTIGLSSFSQTRWSSSMRYGTARPPEPNRSSSSGSRRRCRNRLRSCSLARP